MHRGDEIAITVAGHRVAGTPEEVGPDLLAVRTPAGRVEVHQTATIPFWFEVAMRATEGGHRGSDAAGGRFRAALMMRGADARVTLGTRDHPDGIDGSLVVGADHVVLTRTGGLEVVVPIVDVAWVRVAGD
jgi:hypothetical protein